MSKLVLFGILLILLTSIWVQSTQNTTRTFEKLHNLLDQGKDIEYYYSAAKIGRKYKLYVLSVEKDLRFYPNKFIIIVEYMSGELQVDLISGPGEGSVLRLEGEKARNYLASMSLNHPQ